jgi:hypothetical protein
MAGTTHTSSIKYGLLFLYFETSIYRYGSALVAWLNVCVTFLVFSQLVSGKQVI